MKSKLALILLLVIAATNTAFAHCKDTTKYYGGGGVGFNSGNNDDANGFQFLGGYCLPYNFKNRKTTTSVELGYMNSGDFGGGSRTKVNGKSGNVTSTSLGGSSYEGVWVSGLAEYKFENKLNFLARVGYDIGDDNGVMLGGGLGYNVTRGAQVRAEYVARNETDSVQLNYISQF